MENDVYFDKQNAAANALPSFFKDKYHSSNSSGLPSTKSTEFKPSNLTQRIIFSDNARLSRSSLLIPQKSAALFNRQNEKGIEIFSDITPPHPSDYSDMSARKGVRVFGDQPRLCLIIVRLQKSTTVN